MSRPPRIATVVKEFPVVSQTFVASEVIGLKRRGAEVLVLSLAGGDAPRHDFVARAGLTESAVFGRDRFLPALSEFAPDVLHAHFATEATEAARRLGAELTIPFTFTAHGYDVYDEPPDDFGERARAAAAVVTVSSENARQIVRRFGVADGHLHVIPCGVDLDRVAGVPAAPRHDGPPLVVCVARHKAVKNLGLLVEACALLRGRGIEFRGILIGDGPCRPAIERQIELLDVESCVELTGALDHDEVLTWWRRASIAVLCSRREGLPVCLIEAAACGVPAVATRVGGVPELVEEGVTGLLTPAGDAAALSDALARLLCDQRLAAAMGSAAKERIERHFSLDRQVDALLRLWSA